MTTTRTYAGLSSGARRAQRRARLVEAGLDLAGTDGLAGTTMKGVCRRAGLTERYFYESFDDLDGLLLAVFDHVAGLAAQTLIDAVAGASGGPRHKAQDAVEALVALVTDDPRIARFAFVESLGTATLRERRQAAQTTLAALVAAQWREHQGISDPDGGLELDAILLAGGLAEAIVAWLQGTLPVSREELIRRSVSHWVAVAGAHERRQARATRESVR